jgi:hypothetical protein
VLRRRAQEEAQEKQWRVSELLHYTTDTCDCRLSRPLLSITLHAPLNQEWETPFRSQRKAHWGKYDTTFSCHCY